MGGKGFGGDLPRAAMDPTPLYVGGEGFWAPPRPRISRATTTTMMMMITTMMMIQVVHEIAFELAVELNETATVAGLAPLTTIDRVVVLYPLAFAV